MLTTRLAFEKHEEIPILTKFGFKCLYVSAAKKIYNQCNVGRPGDNMG